ncbi:unnamed protein product [Prorocentrum cordatum]|uniref:Uncharacterized protein n=1 Tax=Prorocentrum cordatum TaxID=2364126 RepID=A0ABN9RS84_9DINO|nr:unnamed protein product [Polarella glacialis]
MNRDFGRQMQRVWDEVIVPALASTAGECRVDGQCEYMSDIADRWLLYMETFLHVLTYLTAHPDMCPSYINAIQASWNDLADGTQLAYGSSKWVYEFWWSDFMNHPHLEQRPRSMEGVYRQMDLDTTWNPFRSTSSLDRILSVARKLGIYNARGEVAAPECLPPPPRP